MDGRNKEDIQILVEKPVGRLKMRWILQR